MKCSRPSFAVLSLLVALCAWRTCHAASAGVSQLNHACPAGSAAKTVLILGSGLVGSELAHELLKRPCEFHVLLVRSRAHVDLRRAGALDEFIAGHNVDFVYFCAFDVGGSKLLESTDTSVQTAMLMSNTLLYQSVFKWLQDRGLPFLFFSSYRKHEDSVYGCLKALGEQWVRYIPNGRVARLWNTYGFEPVSVRSHVIVDWIHQCYTRGIVQAHTDGTEIRRFVHVLDAVALFISSMQRFAEIDFAIDVAGSSWISLRDLGAALERVSSSFDRPCTVQWALKRAGSNITVDPVLSLPLHEAWAPRFSLEDGLAEVYQLYLSHFLTNDREL